MAKGEFKETAKISDEERMKMFKDQGGKNNHCFTEFTNSDQHVLDHCHYSNEIKALLHQSCNLSRVRKKKLPVIAQNAMR